MKPWSLLVSICLLAAAGCAERPAYFGSAARVTRENGASYWEAPAMSPPYMRVRMRRPARAPRPVPAVYEGALTLRSISPAVLRSSFTVAEGSSASLHFDLNPRATAVRYEPGALDVVVACARGECRASSTPAPIWDDGTVALKLKRPARRRGEKRAASRKAADAGALAAAADLREDGECAALDQTVSAAAARTAKTGEGETRTERAARNRYVAEGCAAWLDAHGGAAAARRRVRLSRWTSLGGR
ncbi:MAG TPA: hypothetical protein VN915_11825 [Elusimicrobiota bacterium]|nr:hypothetical protein [Elusimicrobiota bacterium]